MPNSHSIIYDTCARDIKKRRNFFRRVNFVYLSGNLTYDKVDKFPKVIAYFVYVFH